MRTWAQRTNRERGGYQGRPVHEGRGWGDRMVQLWGSDSSYVLSRQSLVSDLQRLGFGLK